MTRYGQDDSRDRIAARQAAEARAAGCLVGLAILVVLAIAWAGALKQIKERERPARRNSSDFKLQTSNSPRCAARSAEWLAVARRQVRHDGDTPTGTWDLSYRAPTSAFRTAHARGQGSEARGQGRDDGQPPVPDLRPLASDLSPRHAARALRVGESRGKGIGARRLTTGPSCPRARAFIRSLKCEV